jgi:hypothetical protein
MTITFAGITKLIARVRRQHAATPQVGFAIARDWLLVLVVSALVLGGSAGYAAIILAQHSILQGEFAGVLPPEIPLSRDTIRGVIDAYDAKDANFSTRAQALVEVADPSL